VVVEDVEESIEIHLGVELSVLESCEGLLRVVRRVLDRVLGDVVPWPARRVRRSIQQRERGLQIEKRRRACSLLSVGGMRESVEAGVESGVHLIHVSRSLSR